MFGAQDGFQAIQLNQLSPGAVFEGRFQILSILGKGGVGVVYKAQHLHMGKLEAIKTLMPSMVSDDHSFERFEHEARAASNLTHPNIITIHDFGRSADGTAYLVMEYLDGKTLTDLMQQCGTLDLDLFLRIFTQICDGLQHAHKKGVVHRDMKPSNVMLINQDDATDVVKIVDFGLAKIAASADSQQHLTQTGAVVGTPLFMSPEQCRGGQLDHRTDIYSVGCMMYAALCGRVPHMGDTALNTMVKHMVEEPLPFSESIPEIILPPSLESVILKSLSKNPQDRQQSMSELKSQITDAIYFRHAPQPAKSTEVTAKQDSTAIALATPNRAKTSSQDLNKKRSDRQPEQFPNKVLATLVITALTGAAVLWWVKFNPHATPTRPTVPATSIIPTVPVTPTIPTVPATSITSAVRVTPTIKLKAAAPKVSAHPNDDRSTSLPKIASVPPPKITHVTAPHVDQGIAIKESLEAANEFFSEGNLPSAIASYEKARAHQIAAEHRIGAPVFVTDSRIVDCWVESESINNAQPFLAEAERIYDKEEEAVKIVAARNSSQSVKIWFPLARACFMQARAAGEHGNSPNLGWAAIFGLNAVESWSGPPDSTMFTEMKATCVEALSQVNPEKAVLFREKYNMPQPFQVLRRLQRKFHRYPLGSHIRDY